MAKAKSSDGDALTPEQQRCCEEWRQLCFTLERAQADDLVQNCRDKFRFAKTYLVYGSLIDQTLVEVRQSASQGNYSFFTDRGIPGKPLTPAVAERMIDDWKGAVASKKAHVAETFMRRFGEDIDQFIGTPHNGSRLMMAERHDRADAIIQMAELTEVRLTGAELANMRADLAQIKTRLNELSDTLLREIRELAAQVKKA